ncbi:S-adenosyl-L-methionine-dependent methyltransferase [Hyaloraphidium curvatum]|nr:S-adenosyl-L-methionine-dependent methyltransferase [Hyaloraphidium curvatum]
MATGLEARGNEPQYRRILNEFVDAVLSPLDGLKSPVIAEVGCGSGSLTRQLARRVARVAGARVVGVDPSPALLRIADEFARAEKDSGSLLPVLEWRVGTCESPNLVGADLIMVATVFSHLADPSTAITGLLSALKPGGTLAIFDQDYTTLISHGPQRFLELFPKVYRGNWRLRVEAGDVGRRLFSLLSSHPGVAKSSAHARAYSYSEHGRSAYLHSLLERGGTAAVQAGEMTQEELKEWVGVVAEVQMEGQWFAALTYVGAWAKKAEGSQM